MASSSTTNKTPPVAEVELEPGKLLIDTIKPTTPNDFVFNRNAWQHLAAISTTNDMPHLLIHGPPGSGKKTMVLHLLRAMFGPDVDNMQLEPYKVKSSGNNTQKVVPIMQSNNHIVVQPNNNNFDRYIIQDVITQYARQVPFQIFNTRRSFRAVVINGIDRVSKQAQMSLRSTMENYSRQCRLIMWCTSAQKVIKPLRSRCFCIALQAPQIEDVQLCIARAILLNRLPREFLRMTTVKTRDHREAFRELEAMRAKMTHITSYDTQIIEIIQLIIERNSENLMEIRSACYELMITNFTGSQIITSIVDALLKDERIKDEDKVCICEIAALYESLIVAARREIRHLDPFVNAVMIQVKLPAAQRVRRVPKPVLMVAPAKAPTPSTNKKKPMTLAKNGQNKKKKRASSTTPTSSRKTAGGGGRGRARSRSR